MCVKLYEFMCIMCVASHGTHGCQVPWCWIIDSSKPSDMDAGNQTRCSQLLNHLSSSCFCF